MHDPIRNVPRALFIGTGIVIVLYVSLNAVFLVTTPIKELASQLDVAIIAGKHIFGDLGGRLVGALICLGLISSISAMTWIGPRVAMTMGEDLPLLRLFSRKSKQNAPIAAIVLQLLISNVLLLTQSFEAVLDFIQFSLTFCSFFTALGVIKMRITHPELPRPDRLAGFPVTPIDFSQRHALHDVLSRGQSAAAVPGGHRHDVGRSHRLLYVAPALERSFRYFANGGLETMFATMPKTMAAALTAVILTVAAAPAWSAETATFNDTARFLAGLPPSPDLPLAPLTKDAAWQQHARYFDLIFAREDSAHLSKFAPSPANS